MLDDMRIMINKHEIQNYEPDISVQFRKNEMVFTCQYIDEDGDPVWNLWEIDVAELKEKFSELAMMREFLDETFAQFKMQEVGEV